MDEREVHNKQEPAEKGAEDGQALYTRVHVWAIKKANGARARAFLFLWSFAESSFWPIPVDVLLVAMIATGAKRWFKLSFLVAVFSVLGGMAGYLIGFAFFDLFGERIVNFYSLQEEFLVVQGYFEQNTFWTMFISAFTPIPYKLFTIAGGFFQVNIVSFILASFLGRGLRFIGVGFISYKYGEKTLDIILKHFRLATFVAVLIFILILFLL